MGAAVVMWFDRRGNPGNAVGSATSWAVAGE